MPYSKFELASTDLDLYFKDSQKNIHIASGGGDVPQQISVLDQEIEVFSRIVQDLEFNWEVEINPNLNELLGLNRNGLELYLNDFVLNAKKGFYSYDKTILSSFEDGTFHLVAKPIRNGRIEPAFLNIPKIELITLSTEFVTFDLFLYLGHR